MRSIRNSLRLRLRGGSKVAMVTAIAATIAAAAAAAD